MTQPPLPRIDWRDQLERLEPYLSRRGGVVHARTSERSPGSNFSKVVRHLMDAGGWERPWRHVQLDVRNPNTHYLDDVVAQLERSLELDLGGAGGEAGPIRVATDIEAEEVTISDIEISVGEDDYARAGRALDRLDRVVEAIRERLRTARVGLFFLDSHAYDRKTLRRFREVLWDGRLDAMAEEGLLLIDISDPSLRGDADWPPDPDLELDLPERFDDTSRLAAHADLAALALEEGLVSSAGEAEVFAEVLLSSSDSVRDVYANLARARARMRDMA